jgi:hypothetical protein
LYYQSSNGAKISMAIPPQAATNAPSGPRNLQILTDGDELLVTNILNNGPGVAETARRCASDTGMPTLM